MTVISAQRFVDRQRFRRRCLFRAHLTLWTVPTMNHNISALSPAGDFCCMSFTIPFSLSSYLYCQFSNKYIKTSKVKGV